MGKKKTLRKKAKKPTKKRDRAISKGVRKAAYEGTALPRKTYSKKRKR